MEIDPTLLEKDCKDCTCSICCGVMVDPHIVCKLGHSFCKTCVHAPKEDVDEMGPTTSKRAKLDNDGANAKSARLSRGPFPNFEGLSSAALSEALFSEARVAPPYGH